MGLEHIGFGYPYTLGDISLVHLSIEVISYRKPGFNMII